MDAYVLSQFSTRPIAGKEVELGGLRSELRDAHGPDSADDFIRDHNARDVAPHRKLSRYGADTATGAEAGTAAQGEATAGACEVASAGACVPGAEPDRAARHPRTQPAATGN